MFPPAICMQVLEVLAVQKILMNSGPQHGWHSTARHGKLLPFG